MTLTKYEELLELGQNKWDEKLIDIAIIQELNCLLKLDIHYTFQKRIIELKASGMLDRMKRKE